MFLNKRVLKTQYFFAYDREMSGKQPEFVGDSGNEGGLLVFCDICGTHDNAAAAQNDPEQTLIDFESILPDGWIALNDTHLCPSCAIAYKGIARSARYEETLPRSANTGGIRPLTAEGAAALIPDENGQVVVPEGYDAIGYKAFMYRKDIRAIVLPSTLRHVHEFAFACSGLEQLRVPAGLESIGRRAFYQCQHLNGIELNDDLVELGDDAFMESGLRQLVLPAGLKRCGRGIAQRTPATTEAPCAVSVDERNAAFAADEVALYAWEGESLLFKEALVRSAAHIEIVRGTSEILPYAFEGCARLTSVKIPDSVRVIREGAFAGCVALANVVLPSELVALDIDAFSHTGIRRINIPAHVRFIGPRALESERFGADGTPLLRRIEVDPGNRTFYCKNDLLCLRGRKGRSSVLRCVNAAPTVALPDDVDAIAPQAFTHSPNIRELRFARPPASVHPSAFPARLTETLRFELPEEVCGRTYALVHSPFALMLVLACFDGPLDIGMLFALRDDVSFDSYAGYDAEYVLDRLSCPQYLRDSTRADFEASLRDDAERKLLMFVKAGNMHAIEQMGNLGFLNAQLIDEAVDRAADSSETSMVGYLLDLKKRCFGNTYADFSI